MNSQKLIFSNKSTRITGTRGGVDKEMKSRMYHLLACQDKINIKSITEKRSQRPSRQFKSLT